jgi:hypothetical protein
MRNLIRMLLKIVILVAPNFHSVSTLALLPKRKVANVQKQNFNKNIQVSTKDDNAVNSLSIKAPDRDEMISRAAVLRQSILKQQLELQQLERQIVCCSSKASYSSPSTGIYSSPIDYIIQTSEQARLTFMSSFDALNRKILRVKQKQGKRNKKYKNVEEYIVSQTLTSGRILSDLARNPDRLLHLADPNTPSLVPHLPAIYARMDQLEPHVKPILEKVLNNREHLKSIEPYLGQVLERFDDIEPHFPWILKNVDILAPYTGLLLKHIDELLLYADSDLDEANEVTQEERYALAEQLLPYLEFYVSRLDMVGPHLPLLRPHIPKLLKGNRIAKITPHIDRLFVGGYMNLGTSANLDVLLFWVGWTLYIPLVPRLFFAIPGSPRFVTFLANKLPRRFVRRYCSGVSCSIDGDYGKNWNRLSKD